MTKLDAKNATAEATASTHGPFSCNRPNGLSQPFTAQKPKMLGDVTISTSITIIHHHSSSLTGWWFGTMEFGLTFHWEWHNHPNWVSYFSEGLKPPTRLVSNLGTSKHHPKFGQICYSITPMNLRVNYNDFTVLPKPGNHRPFTAQQFRLVTYYDLPRRVCIPMFGWLGIHVKICDKSG